MEKKSQRRPRGAIRETVVVPKMTSVPKSDPDDVIEVIEEGDPDPEPYQRRWDMISKRDAAARDAEATARRQSQQQQHQFLPFRSSTISADATGNSEDKAKAMLRRALGNPSRAQDPRRRSNISAETGYDRRDDQAPVDLFRNLRMNPDYDTPLPSQKATHEARPARGENHPVEEGIIQHLRPSDAQANENSFTIGRRRRCHECGKTLDSQSALDKHLMTHAAHRRRRRQAGHKQEMFFCPHAECEVLMFSRRDDRDRHVEDMHRRQGLR